MRKLTTAVSLILSCVASASFGQKIEVGQDASRIKSLIEWQARTHNRTDSYGNRASSRASFDVIYQDGEIEDVIICYDRQYLIDFRLTANFCKHYMMDDGALAYVLTQYENVSTSKLIEIYDRKYSDNKVGDYYFTEDFANYSRIYLAKNGQATVDWRKTYVDYLPSEIGKSVASKLKAAEEEKRKKEEEKRIKAQRKREIKSKTYDLSIHDNSSYTSLVEDLRGNLEYKLLTTDYFPQFDEINQLTEKYTVFENTCNAHYKLVDHGREAVNRGSYIVSGTIDIRREYSFTHLSGADLDCRLIKSIKVDLPKLTIEGYEVMTEAKLDSISISNTRGITKIKVKNGVATFSKYPPPIEVRSQLLDRFTTEKNGSYKIKYQIGHVMDSDFIVVEEF